MLLFFIYALAKHAKSGVPKVKSYLIVTYTYKEDSVHMVKVEFKELYLIVTNNYKE